MRKSGLLNLCLVCSCLGLGIFNSALALDSPPLITRQPTLELKPIPSEAFQLAKATFLPDYVEGPFSGYSSPIDYNPKGDCDDTSSLYTKNNCTYPKTVVPSSQCPFKPGYYTECKCLPKFKLTSCKSPYILGGDSCDGKYEKCVCPSSVSMYYPNDYCTQYCEGKCIAKSCSRTPNETGCQYGTGSTSDGCGGTRVYCKADPCLSVSCGSNAYCSGGSCYCNSGYEGNAYSGCSKKPTCTANSCSGYTLSSCPNGSSCSSCTIKYSDCSSGGTKYKVTTSHTHSYSCPSGYQSSSCSSSQTQLGTADKTCSCGATSGTCYKCQDKGKTCTVETCSNYTLSSKSDSNANYSSCTPVSSDCSTGSTKYKKTGCKSGYHDEGGSCKKDCEAGCSGYSLSTCPSNANCNSCTKKNSNCSNGSKVYKITSCKSGYTLSGSSCVKEEAQITEGKITIISKFPSDFSNLAWGPWGNFAYKEPGQSVYNINFQRGEVDANNKTWTTTPMYPYTVKLGGELKVSASTVSVPCGTYELCDINPRPKNYSIYNTENMLYDVPTGNENYTVTLTYCKK